MASVRVFHPGAVSFGPGDFKANARRFLERGLLLSALIHLSLLGAYRAASDSRAPHGAAEPRGRSIQVQTVRVAVALARLLPPVAQPSFHGAPNLASGLIAPVPAPIPSPIFYDGALGPDSGVSAGGPATGDGRREAPSGPAEERATPFGVVDVQPEPIDSPRPEYPDWAREAGIQGTVLLHVLVGTDGRVKRVVVIRGVRGLDEDASKMVKGWMFRPALSNGNPVEVWVEVPVAFRL